MKKPEEPFKSGNYVYMPKFKEETLYYRHYIHPDARESWLEDQEDSEVDKSNTEDWNYNLEFLSLDKLLELVPANVDPKEIVVTIHRDRYIQDISVCLKHKTPTDEKAWKAGKAAEDKEYKEKYKVYKEEMKEYEAWKTEQEIKELESKLEKLKK